MASYPTPPPTGSPKHSVNYRPFSPKLPAQETYFHSYSEPGSPSQSQPQPQSQPWDPSRPAPNSQQYPSAQQGYGALPQRRKSSPILESQRPSQQPDPYGIKPPRRPSSPVSPNTSPNRRPIRPSGIPRPLHFSPVNQPPSPFSASRPKPRPGFIKRILDKIAAMLRSFVNWGGKNPIAAGFLTFIPVVAGVGLVRAFKGVGRLIGGGKATGGKGGFMETMKQFAGMKAGKEGAEKKWEYGFSEFVGFAGAKKGDGPLAGILKVVHMLM